MPITFSGLGKARKVKEFLLEMDNYNTAFVKNEYAL
jgi:hypothetical protein